MIHLQHPGQIFLQATDHRRLTNSGHLQLLREDGDRTSEPPVQPHVRRGFFERLFESDQRLVGIGTLVPVVNTPDALATSVAAR